MDRMIPKTRYALGKAPGVKGGVIAIVFNGEPVPWFASPNLSPDEYQTAAYDAAAKLGFKHDRRCRNNWRYVGKPGGKE